MGEAVFYAGDITRAGTNAEYHCVDSRIVGRKPRSLDWAQAAALPLTAITAWETLFDRLDVAKPVPGAPRPCSSSAVPEASVRSRSSSPASLPT